jgi:hypothetical protein
MLQMKRWLLALTAATTLMVAGGARNAQAQTSFYGSASSGSFSISYFYDELDDYGRWVDYGNYGACWVPANVGQGWRPYTYGHWMYTDYGWTWASYEPYGWATYHYGRWVLDPYYGWVWVPGTVWAPAWVAWRESPDYIGWAPLGPEVGWSVSVGLSFGSGYSSSQIAYSNWSFVDRNRFDSGDVRSVVYRADRNDDVFRSTRDVTRFRSRNGSPFNEGVAVSNVERSTGRRIPRMRVAAVDSPNRGTGRQVSGQTVGFFRPNIRGSRRDLTTQIERRGGRMERVSPGRARSDVQQRTERARGQSGQLERGRNLQREVIDRTERAQNRAAERQRAERSQGRAAERQRVERSRETGRDRSFEQNPARNVERQSRVRTERAPREFQRQDRGRDMRTESAQERREAPPQEQQREVRSEERGRSRESTERGRGNKGGKGNKDKDGK